MSRKPVAYKEAKIKVATSYKYTCDTCSYEFKKGESKITYFTDRGKLHACINRPCCPFSEPKDYERVWSIKKQKYVWKKLLTEENK